MGIASGTTVELPLRIVVHLWAGICCQIVSSLGQTRVWWLRLSTSTDQATLKPLGNLEAFGKSWEVSCSSYTSQLFDGLLVYEKHVNNLKRKYTSWWETSRHGPVPPQVIRLSEFVDLHL